MRLEEALGHTQPLIDVLFNQSCERSAVAGSVRRKKPEVKDIEFVVIPKIVDTSEGQQKLFGGVEYKVNKLDEAIKHLIKQGILEPRKQLSERKAPMGPRTYLLTYHPPSYPYMDISVDVFAVIPPRDWGIIFTIRTGSAEFSKWIVTEARRKGMRVREGQLWKGDTRISCPTEKDFFKALNIDYLEPWNRNEVPT